MASQLGAPLGAPQRGREAAVELSGQSTRRHTVTMTPDLTRKLVIGASEAGLSVSGLLSELVRRMPTDEAGRPEWADELAPADPAKTDDPVPDLADAGRKHRSPNSRRLANAS